MATLTQPASTLLPPAAAPVDLVREHWVERMQQGYFAVRALCARFDLPPAGEFFDACMAEFARAYKRAPKGTQSRNVDLLAAVTIYRQTLAAGRPVRKNALLALLGGPQLQGAFHRVLLSAGRCAPRQDPRVAASRLVAETLNGISAPASVVEVAASILQDHLDAFLATKVNVAAAAVVAAAVLGMDQAHEVPVTRIAGAARVAPSAIDRCLAAVVARLGKPLPGVPSKSSSIFRELFAAGTQSPPD